MRALRGGEEGLLSRLRRVLDLSRSSRRDMTVQQTQELCQLNLEKIESDNKFKPSTNQHTVMLDTVSSQHHGCET